MNVWKKMAYFAAGILLVLLVSGGMFLYAHRGVGAEHEDEHLLIPFSSSTFKQIAARDP